MPAGSARKMPLRSIFQFPEFFLDRLTPHITGSKKQSEERAALFVVRVYVIVMHFLLIKQAKWLGAIKFIFFVFMYVVNYFT